MMTTQITPREAMAAARKHAKTLRKNARILTGLTAVDIGGEVILLHHRGRGELAAALSRSSKVLQARTPFEAWLLRTGTSYGEFSELSGISSRGLLHRYAIGDVDPSLDRKVQIEVATSGDVAVPDWPAAKARACGA